MKPVIYGAYNLCAPFFIFLLVFFQLTNAESIREAFPAPEGYQRVEVSEKSYASYLQNFQVKTSDEPVLLYNGKVSYMWSGDSRPIKYDFLFNEDLEQCADVAYRFWAEYCFTNSLDSLISFRLQNGQLLDWNEWAKGKRLKYNSVKDRHIIYNSAPDSSRRSFNEYLRFLFYWSGSLAVKTYTKKIEETDLEAGDMLVQNMSGGMGHLSIIVDICENKNGERLYLIGNGWTPAVEFFIHYPESNQGSGYWLTMAGYESFLAPHNMGPFNYRRF